MRAPLFAMALLLGACQAEPSGPPPQLSPQMQTFFQEYLAEPSPHLFVLSVDGTWGRYSVCPSHVEHCVEAMGESQSETLAICRREAGMPCKVYAIERKIVWE